MLYYRVNAITVLSVLWYGRVLGDSWIIKMYIWVLTEHLQHSDKKIKFIDTGWQSGTCVWCQKKKKCSRDLGFQVESVYIKQKKKNVAMYLSYINKVDS